MLTTLIKSLNPASVMKYFMRASCLDMYVVASFAQYQHGCQGLVAALGEAGGTEWLHAGRPDLL